MHSTALLCESIKRGEGFSDCLANSNLQIRYIYSDIQNTLLSQNFDAYLVVSSSADFVNQLPFSLFKGVKVLLWESEPHLVSGLEKKFDLIFAQPFNFDEISLITRNHIFMKHTQSEVNRLEVCDVILDFNVRGAVVEGVPLSLSNKEFCLLEFFMRNRSRALTRNQILDNVWDRNQNIFTNTIDVHVAKLRRKLNSKAPDKFIKTVHGFGYMMDV